LARSRHRPHRFSFTANAQNPFVTAFFPRVTARVRQRAGVILPGTLSRFTFHLHPPARRRAVLRLVEDDTAALRFGFFRGRCPDAPAMKLH
jgi:hypothetical protein